MVFKAVLPILILVLAGGIAFSIVKSAPQPERHPKPRQPRLVETLEINLTKQMLTIEAWGQVRPVHQITPANVTMWRKAWNGLNACLLHR